MGTCESREHGGLLRQGFAGKLGTRPGCIQAGAEALFGGLQLFPVLLAARAGLASSPAYLLPGVSPGHWSTEETRGREDESWTPASSMSHGRAMPHPVPSGAHAD